jgi:hypothetical protein
MTIRQTLLVFILSIQISAFAQNFEWKAGMNYFFDNTEFIESTLTRDQTMTGVHFTPQLGLSKDTVHAFYIGGDLLKISGSQNFVDIIRPIAYYQQKTTKSLLYAGVFPRAELLNNYSDLFFQDSISYFQPTLSGIFWQLKNSSSFFNIWLDWNGHQTTVNRETFFVGVSALKQHKRFFAELQSYMFHFANTRPNTENYHLTDNILGQLSIGVNYSNRQGLDTLLISAGVLAGMERDRFIDYGTHTPIGLVLRCNADYKRFGIQNSFYWGNPRMVFYNQQGTRLYSNNPFLRSNYYLESKWYLDVIQSQSFNGKLAIKLHFSEGKLMNEQVFTLKASLESLVGKKMLR